MSSKDKKVRRAALREFLTGIPGVLDRAAVSFGRLVLLVGIAVAALVLHMLFGHGGPPPPPPPGGHGDNPTAALYVRDLGRLADGRHTFDLVYDVVLRNETWRPFWVERASSRLAVGDVAKSGDALDLNEAAADDAADTAPSGALAWHSVLQSAAHRGNPVEPGEWRKQSAHYRINARPEQLADVAIRYEVRPMPHWFDGWFAHPKPGLAYHEEVQLGAVLRAHCALGVKIQNGEMRSLCGL